jgi:hypothetical protein
MNHRTRTVPAFVALLALTLARDALAQSPTTFTYQGQLTSSGSPVNGTVDLRFTLWDALSGGTQIGTAQTLDGVAVQVGLFTSNVDFGAGTLNGAPRWLQVEVANPPGSAFVVLTPRQALTSTPYAAWSHGPWRSGGAGGVVHTDGPVGIGTSSPETYLHIDRPASLGPAMQIGPGWNGGASYNPGVQRLGVYAWDGRPGISFAQQNVGGYLIEAAGQTLVFSAGYDGSGGEKVRIDWNGNVGFGTASPQALLHLNSTDSRQLLLNQWLDLSATDGGTSFLAGNAYARRSDGTVRFTNSHAQIGAVGFAVNSPAWNVAGIFANHGPSTAGSAFTPSWVATFHPSGNVGIGTTTPERRLHVVGTTRTSILEITGGSDLAEPFDIDDAYEVVPGMVVVIDPARDGQLIPCSQPYDTAVAGVVSGARGLSPGMVMAADDVPLANGRHPVAMTGRVWVMADATTSPIRRGDRLTTSSILGHAMRADSARPTDGAVIGKAMSELHDGQGWVLVLINLQ